MPDSSPVLPPQAKAPSVSDQTLQKARRVCSAIASPVIDNATGKQTLPNLFDACHNVNLTVLEFMKACAADRTIEADYHHARESRAAYHGAKLEELPDKVDAGEIDPLKARVSGGLRQWLMQKHDRARYGDAVQIDQRISVKPDLSGVSDAALEELYAAMAARRNAQLPGS